MSDTGPQELAASIGNLLVEFYPGKRKKNGRTIKTGHIYWTFTQCQNGQRQRISPKRYDPAAFGYAGATSIENCPYGGRVEEYWRNSSRATGDTGGTKRLSRGDEAMSAIVDYFEQGENLYVH